ncbi:MAG: four helix bundle protein [Chitinophagaceae bacterium]
MSRDSILKQKSFDFAVRIINLYKFLKTKHKEFIISGQVFRSGTAIGALIREAEHAESRKDFSHKLNISLKEVNESIYWLELLYATGYLNKKMFDSIIKDATGLLKMLIASVRTTKSRTV